MTAAGFRKLALSMPGAIESAHMGHPDFRANGRIFASLWPGGKFGMVKLTPELQREFVSQNAHAFAPVNGAWGADGATRVELKQANEDTLGRAMTEAVKRTIKKPKK